MTRGSGSAASPLPDLPAEPHGQEGGDGSGRKQDLADGARTSPEQGAASATGEQEWHALGVAEAAGRLGVDLGSGLSDAEASARLASGGPNVLPEEPGRPAWRRFLAEYRSYMQLILTGAAIVSLLIKQWSTGVILLLLTVGNAIVGLSQEGKAESAMNALKSMLEATSRVRRDGREEEIPSEQLVVGDVVILSAGDQVPADGRVATASSMQVDESALTGESVPVSKTADALPPGDLSPGEAGNMAFMNSTVTHGSGTLLVTATGGATEVGRISGLLTTTRPEQSPLTRQLNILSLWIAGAAGLTMIVMFAFGRARGDAWDVLFVSAVSLAIAAIPEALPTVSQVILSLGSLELAKRNAIVKDLPSVETLGFTSAINSDKTGTLTMNQMTAVEVVEPEGRHRVSGTGYGLEGDVSHAGGSSTTAAAAILPFVVANDASLVDGTIVGDPTEAALLVLAHKVGLDYEAHREQLPRLATLPFDPGYKLMATFNSALDDSGRPVVRCFVKGAAPAVMARSDIATSHPDLHTRYATETERMGGEGRRVMAAAQRDLDPSSFDPDGDLLGLVSDLELTGLVAMVDPPRDQARNAVADAEAAHIRVRMITGDDITTGAAIAAQLGIGGRAILGSELAAMSEAERRQAIDGIGVIGRVAPEHKVLLSETLKATGETVAMTGDGVNDAPAIKSADIGIAMGSGTDVAKSAGRMILSDDNFATIVYAVKEGRKLYDNLTKYIRFVLVLLVAFVLSFLGAALFNIAAGEPFTSAQVLWIHFLVNAPFGFALGFDQETPGLMARQPEPRGKSVLSGPLVVTVTLVGLAMSVANLLLIELGRSQFGSVAVGSSIAFTSFALMLVVAAFESRSETATVFTLATFHSRQMNRVALIQVALAVLTTQMDALRRLLGTTELDMKQFRWALIPPVVLLGLWEAGKAIARWRHPSPSA